MIAFYRRARPLGLWAPIARLSGELRPASKIRWPIAVGLSLAVAGSIAVMAYITGISQLYVARYRTGFILLSILIASGAIFVLSFPRYIDALLSAEEKRELPADAGSFGLSRVFSMVCFVASFVLAFQTAFLQGGATSMAMCAIAIAGGLVLLHYGRSKGMKQSGI